MKNIHLLPTNKPSRLGQVYEKLSFFKDRTWDNTENWRCKNIYITNDEEITGFENNIWVIKGDRIFLWQNTMALVSNNKPKKIILTTDPDLIADGVQAIDDEFLEWFVKNPSCEEVEVVEELNMNGKNGLDRARFIYKIIIPKEEPKQETLEEEFKFKNRQMGAAGFVGNKIMEKMISKFKQETLEEASARLAKIHCDVRVNPNTTEFQIQQLIIKGARWQAEKMYSEEEVLNILQEFKRYLSFGDEISQTEWFEQFKKK